MRRIALAVSLATVAVAGTGLTGTRSSSSTSSPSAETSCGPHLSWSPCDSSEGTPDDGAAGG